MTWPGNCYRLSNRTRLLTDQLDLLTILKEAHAGHRNDIFWFDTADHNDKIIPQRSLRELDRCPSDGGGLSIKHEHIAEGVLVTRGDRGSVNQVSAFLTGRGKY